jgi:hypothetical protein
VQSLLGVEDRGQSDQVLLVAAASMVEEQEPLRFRARGALDEG